ncbi:tumor necrosis factor ligand superfamily member 11 isoform X1 [Salmo trutta]|uniref:Tumor necrosis factor ligand superfamily member 11-like n=1 Tax=Salmo trutta TaxID=8032 RepID=A0A674EME3_SALTR|nr:tumor necrosis factor ligand superfamily member 11-like isoform X1 [Salmo trutta]
MESSLPRFQQLRRTEPISNRTLIGTVVFMGLLQVVSSVAVVLHLTGHLQQVTQTGPALVETSDDLQRGESQRCPTKPREVTPSAHLPIQPPSGHIQRDIQNTMIHWDHAHGHLSKIGYHDGRILVREGGLYYIYAKTCFRYYDQVEESLLESGSHAPGRRGASAEPSIHREDGAGAGAVALLIQYVFHERHSHSAPHRPAVLMKSGSTKHWQRSHYHMCCQQQGGAFPLGPGDSIYVSVSNSWLLDPEAEGSYFGAFRISI